MSFCAFSANVDGSEAPSSLVRSSFLPSTPPEALIWLTAMTIASLMGTSLIAVEPDSEFTAPTLIVGPVVLTHERAGPVAVSVARLPHAVSASTATESVNNRMRFLIGYLLKSCRRLPLFPGSVVEHSSRKRLGYRLIALRLGDEFSRWVVIRW